MTGSYEHVNEPAGYKAEERSASQEMTLVTGVSS